MTRWTICAYEIWGQWQNYKIQYLRSHFYKFLNSNMSMKQRELGISIGIQNFLIANLCYYASLLAHLLYMALCLCRSPAYLPGPWPLTPCGRAHCTGGQHGSAQRRAPERPAACRDGAVSPRPPSAPVPPGRLAACRDGATPCRRSRSPDAAPGSGLRHLPI